MHPEALFQVLGPLAVRTETGPAPLGPPLRQAMLGVLLAHANTVVPRDVLIEELWAEDPPDSARAQIQNHVSGLRKALGPAGALLRTQPPGYLLAVPENGLDESAFRTDLSDGRALWEAGDEAGAQSSFRRAVDRCRGPAYDGVDVPSVRAAAAELDELRIDALEDWAQSALAAADAADVAAELARELVTHPLRERLRALLMQAQDRIGRRDDALRVYDEGRALIASELGVQPGLRLQNLHRESCARTGRKPTVARPRPR